MRVERVAFGLWIALGAMLGAFALGTPRQAGPDEPAHAIRAAGLIRGDVFGDPVPASDASRVYHVPAWVGQPDPTCFAFHEDQAAGCASVDGEVAATDLVSTAGTYPVFGHVLPGIGTLVLSDASSLWIARLLGVAFASALLAAALWLLRRNGKPAELSATMLALTPAAFSTMVVINPSGPTVAGAVALTAALLCDADRSRLRSVVVAVAASTVALARSDGWFWLLVIAGLLTVLPGRASAAPWASVGRVTRVCVAAALAISVGWSALIRPELVPIDTDLDGGALVAAVVQRTTDNLEQAIGLFGWVDTRIPSIAMFLWFAAVGASVLAAVRAGERRAVGLAAAALAVFVGIGWAADLLSARSVGLVWQGRYALPVLIAGVMMLGRRGDDADRPAWGEGRVLGAVAALVWVMGAYQALRRWSVGAHGALSPWSWERGGSAVHPGVCLFVFVLGAAAAWWLTFASGSAVIAPPHDGGGARVTAGEATGPGGPSDRATQR